MKLTQTIDRLQHQNKVYYFFLVFFLLIVIQILLDKTKQADTYVTSAVTLLSSYTATLTARFLTLVDKESAQYRNMTEQIETKVAK